MSRLNDILLGLKYLFTFRFDKTAITRQLEYERELLNVVATLPMKYSYKQVERALKASDATPEMIYISLATGEHTLVLEQFYAALREGEEMLDERETFVSQCRKLREAVGELFRLLFSSWMEPIMQKIECWLRRLTNAQ